MRLNHPIPQPLQPVMGSPQKIDSTYHLIGALTVSISSSIWQTSCFELIINGSKQQQPHPWF